MSENHNETLESLMQNWLQGQHKLVQSWIQDSDCEATRKDNNPDDWSKSLLEWWHNANNHSPEINQLFDKVSGIGNSYMQFAEQIVKSGNDKNGSVDILAWLEHSEQLNQNWVSHLNTLLAQQDQAPNRVTKDNWQTWRDISHRVFNICNNFQSQFGDFKIPGAENTWDSFFNFFDLAESVFFRDVEREIQQLIIYFNRYKKATIAYNLILAKNSLQATQILKQNFSPSDDNADIEIATLRALYDHWVSVNEKVFAESALSEEYRQAYGELLNSYLNFKKAWDDTLAKHYQPLNLTSRSELDSLLASHQRLQRENKQLNDELQRLTARLDSLENKNNYGDGE